MRLQPSFFVALLLVLGGAHGRTQEPLALYDDFSSPRIDPDRWIGGGGGDPSLDVVRRVRFGELRLFNRSYAQTDSNLGSRLGQVAAAFTNQRAITAIQATVRVDALATRACSANETAGRAFAQLFGSYFNSATPIPNSHLNDVAAIVDITRSSDSLDPPNVLRINAGVLLCSTPQCSDGTTLAGSPLGTVAAGVPVTIRVQWEPANDRFVFQRGNRPAVFALYTVSDVAPAGNPNKILAVNASVPNCAVTRRPAVPRGVAVERHARVEDRSGRQALSAVASWRGQAVVPRASPDRKPPWPDRPRAGDAGRRLRRTRRGSLDVACARRANAVASSHRRGR
jgi:hypothetical protein